MKFTVKQPYQKEDQTIALTEIPLENIKLDNHCILSIDGSTSNTGMAIIRECDGAIMYLMTAERSHNENETPVQYKVRLKRAVHKILALNRLIYQVYYEEPVVSNISSVKNLFMLRTFVEELIVENEPELDYIKHYEVPNMKWKAQFLAPEKVPQGTAKQKAAVRDKMVKCLPFMADVTQDEIDAASMGCAAVNLLRSNKSGEELTAKKKVRPFKFEVVFIGINDDQDLLEDFADYYKGPEYLVENGIMWLDLPKRKDFDKSVYELIGEKDCIGLIKFASDTHCNTVLEHKIGNLAAQFDYIGAIVWRKNRK